MTDLATMPVPDLVQAVHNQIKKEILVARVLDCVTNRLSEEHKRAELAEAKIKKALNKYSNRGSIDQIIEILNGST